MHYARRWSGGPSTGPRRLLMDGMRKGRRGAVWAGPGGADRRGGNVGPYLDLDPRRGLVGLAFGRNGASAAGPVEEELQEGPGFMVLAGVERPDSGLSVSAELVTAAGTTLRETFDDGRVDAGEGVAS